jgi:hypothetical protein
MLEHSTLLIHDWTQSVLPDGEAAWIRVITAADGARLGFARYAGELRRTWFSWLRTRRLDVYETDDAAHLMSLVRSWTAWEVDDADHRHVGTIYVRTIVSSDGDLLGYIDHATEEQGRILDHEGHVLMQYQQLDTSTELTFGTPANPFLRMILLGCILVMNVEPR